MLWMKCRFINNTIRASQLQRQSENSDNTENKEQIAPVRTNLPYVKGTSEQLKSSMTITSIAHFTQLQHDVHLSHAKDPVLSEQRNNIVYKYDCKDCKAVYFGESKQTTMTLTGKTRKIMDYETNTTTRKIKETIHSLSNNNHINGISYRLQFPALELKGGSEVNTSSNQNEETNSQSQASTVSTQV